MRNKMENNAFNFTKELIIKLVLPKQGRDIYKDTKERGLILIVSYTGGKTFYIAKNIKTEPGKKYYRKKIGDFPDLSIAEARTKVFNLKTHIARGFNPFKKVNKDHEEIIFEDLFDKYINNYAKHNTKCWKADVAEINEKAITLFNKKVSSITKNEIHDLFNHLTPRGKYSANRFLDRLKAIFNKAIEWGLLDKNPTKGIKKHKEKSRDRYITLEEKDQFFQAVHSESNTLMRNFILMSLYTGARKGNMLSMRWKDISFNNKLWYISDTKNGESQNVVLSEEALKILKEMHESAKSEWVFPSDSSASGHLQEPKKAWKRICQRAGMDDLRIHDLRRTRGSWMAITGASQYVIGKALNHKSPRSTAIYARLSLDPVRESLEKADRAFVNKAG
jgi:integrase